MKNLTKKTNVTFDEYLEYKKEGEDLRKRVNFLLEEADWAAKTIEAPDYDGDDLWEQLISEDNKSRARDVLMDTSEELEEIGWLVD